MTKNTSPIQFDAVTQMVSITIPMQLSRRPGRKVILAPQGAPDWAPSRFRVDDTLVKALARGHRWKRMLESGRFASAHEIAKAEHLTHSFVCRMLRLTLLAPDIVEAILDGTLRRELLLTDLLRPLPQEWAKQREALN